VDAPLRAVSRGVVRGREGRLSAGPAASHLPPEEGTGLERLGRRLLVPLGLGVLVVLGLVWTADPRELAASLRRFDLRLLVPVLGLSLVNYALRFVRWELYLKKLQVPLSRGRSLAIFLVGFLLSVTPGKAGELGKAWLVRELGGGPALRVVPAVIGERLLDLLGTLVLVAIGVLAFPGGLGWSLALLSAVILGTVILTWKRGAEIAFRLLGRLPLIGPRTAMLSDLYGNLRSLLTPGLFAAGMILSIVAWGAEGIGFFLVVRAYAPAAGVLPALFNYTAATSLGGLSMLPGGLGAAEGSLAALLHAQGLSTPDANLITLVIRGATLWFAVVLGLLALPYVVHRLATGRDRGRF
jgi:glycosyltransferase 2 family protein